MISFKSKQILMTKLGLVTFAEGNWTEKGVESLRFQNPQQEKVDNSEITHPHVANSSFNFTMKIICFKLTELV